MKHTSSWHFPRAELADSYLDQLNAGLNSIAIFAERRKGKTEFLLDDLAPAAQSRGLRTVYVNFWERQSDPVYCVARGVLRSIESQSQNNKRWKQEYTLKLGVVESKVSQIQPHSAPELAGEALELLLAQDGGLLLMFDEIQHLASDPNFEELIASLRTFLDTNKQRVRAVFTGSSQDRLNRIFRRQNAAFYRGASLVNFPDMGRDFVAFLTRKFHDLTRRSVSESQCLKIFEQYNKSPFFIVDLLQTMMREGIYDTQQGLQFYLIDNNPDNEWIALWESLKPIDRLLLKSVIIEERPFYHSDTFQFLEDQLGVETVSRGTVQSSLNRLREQGILNNEFRGQWVFESNEFREFVSLL